MEEGELGGDYSTYRVEGGHRKQAFSGEVKGKGTVFPLQTRCGPEGG